MLIKTVAVPAEKYLRELAFVFITGSCDVPVVAIVVPRVVPSAQIEG